MLSFLLYTFFFSFTRCLLKTIRIVWQSLSFSSFFRCFHHSMRNDFFFHLLTNKNECWICCLSIEHRTSDFLRIYLGLKFIIFVFSYVFFACQWQEVKTRDLCAVETPIVLSIVYTCFNEFTVWMDVLVYICACCLPEKRVYLQIVIRTFFVSPFRSVHFFEKHLLEEFNNINKHIHTTHTQPHILWLIVLLVCAALSIDLYFISFGFRSSIPGNLI